MKPEEFWESELTVSEVMDVLNQVLTQSYGISDVYGLFIEKLDKYLEDRKELAWELEHCNDSDDDDDWYDDCEYFGECDGDYER